MSTMHPIRVGSDPSRDPPESLMEVTITIEHRRDLSPAHMAAAAARAAERVDAALREIDFSDLPVLRVETDIAWRMRNPGPLFPLRMGDRLFTCRLDVEEAIERLCAGTELQNLAVDGSGHAYEVLVHVAFTRARGLDGRLLPGPGGEEEEG